MFARNVHNRIVFTRNAPEHLENIQAMENKSVVIECKKSPQTNQIIVSHREVCGFRATIHKNTSTEAVWVDPPTLAGLTANEYVKAAEVLKVVGELISNFDQNFVEHSKVTLEGELKLLSDYGERGKFYYWGVCNGKEQTDLEKHLYKAEDKKVRITIERI